MHIYHIGLRIEMIVPDIFQKHGTGHDMPGIAHEIFQQLEFAGLEGNDLAAARHGAGEQINFKVSGLQLGFRGLLGIAPPQAFNAGQEFGKGIGFRQIIIAAGAQAPHALVDIAQGAEDQGGRGNALGPQGADDRKAVKLGQHAVHNQNVMEALKCHGQAVFAIGRVVGYMSTFRQSLDKPYGGVTVIFNHKYAHLLRGQS